MNKIPAQLIENFRRGDRRAAASLFEQLRRPLFGYFYRLCSDRFVAEDLLQETLLTIHSRIETFNSDFEFMPWAYAVARNKFFEFKRSQNRVVRLQIVSVSAVEEPGHEGFSAGSDLSLDVKKILEDLSEPIREAFILKHFQNLTFERVAELQEVPLPTAKSRVLFALKKIREYLHRGEK
ncbi:MAG: RNA polymerase sigma factor [Candidatus Rifleibacteriota bacterium]